LIRTDVHNAGIAAAATTAEPPFGARAWNEHDRGERERQKQRANIFCSRGEPGIGADEDRAQRRWVLQKLDQRREPENQKGRHENIFLHDARMHGDDRGCRRRRGCRQGAELGQHQPPKPIGGEHEETAGKRRASPPDFDKGLEIARAGEQIGELCHLDHEERVVIAIVARPHGIDLGPFIAKRA
jgi:hypothetical protein